MLGERAVRADAEPHRHRAERIERASPGRDVDATEQEIVEAIAQFALDSGWPEALTAVAVVGEVIHNKQGRCLMMARPRFRT